MPLLLLAWGWGGAVAYADPASHYVLRGGRLPGGRAADVEVRDGSIASVGSVDAPGVHEVDVSGRWLAPAFVDSHVHLAYLPVQSELADGGVAAVVDLAAPIDTLAKTKPGPRVLGSGPMITAAGGYPTRSWGRGGYGLECVDSIEAVVAAVDKVHAAGARVVKLPVAGAPELSEAVLRAAVERAHALGLKVVSHALDDRGAALAAEVGVDVLAHTPTQPLSEATVEAWRGRAVISTLRAFGGSPATVDNLRRLRAAGVTVVYGTDLGNTRDARIDPVELGLLAEAGLDPAAVLAAGTTAPARLWGLGDLGALDEGRVASLLVLDADPLKDPATVSRPVEVILDGAPRGLRPGLPSAW